MESETFWFNRVIVVVVILSGIYLYKKLCPSQKEYFTQKTPFILKQDNDVYDPFYLEYYDELHASQSYCDDDFRFIMESAPPTKKSVILDIGCGTGMLLRSMEDAGFTAFGVDKSASMVGVAKDRLKHTEVYCNDVLVDPMLYDSNTFSHILCTHFTLYEIERKEMLFRHCFNWLQCGGVLVVHLVDPGSYKKVLPSMYGHGEPFAGVTKTKLEYHDYTYRGEYGSNPDVFKETFTDKFTEKVRQNQSRLHMVAKDTVLATALRCGFQVKREMVYTRDPHQFLVVLEKPMCGLL